MRDVLKSIPVFEFLKYIFFPKSQEQAWHDYYNVFLKEISLIQEFAENELKRDSKVLVFGCGYNYPDVLLFSTISENTYGIDILSAFYRDGLSKIIVELYRQGFSWIESIARGIKTWMRYRVYYSHLLRFSGKPLLVESLNIQTVGPSRLPYPDNHFDFVVSNVVLEHVENPLSTLAELYRVTKSGGLSIHVLHNYQSLSGSHVPEFIYNRYPWGHLLGVSVFKQFLNMTRVFLNQITPKTLRENFEYTGFKEILFAPIDRFHNIMGRDDKFQFDGSEILDSEENDRLSAEQKKLLLEKYDRETLLCRSYLYIMRKKQ